MQIKTINQDLEKSHQEKLGEYYKNNLIPAEKKAYLTKHRASIGPYLAIQEDEKEPAYFLDAASQIATLGLGFNPTEFMGTGHLWESWTNNNQTEQVENIRESLHKLLTRELGWENSFLTLCNSGAEANEVALGQCFLNRKNKRANKVLAFEGSFHGRMFVSLFSTWNPGKRVPFEYDGYQTQFTPFPEIKTSDFNVDFPEDWISNWSNATLSNFKIPKGTDEITKLEIDHLMQVRKKLMSGEIFAIIVEPMQCEGGDRYATNRFFSGLIALANAFNVSLIFDEVQTGFHLGRKFFWHRDLELKDDQGTALYPDYVVCAKKAQVALVLSHHEIEMNEQYQVASLTRGMIHAQALSQSINGVLDIEKQVTNELEKLSTKYDKHLANPRARGLAFAIDVQDKTKVMDIINERFKHALLYYPAGDGTLRFRMNLAMKEKDVNFLFTQLDAIFDKVFNQKEPSLPTEIETTDRNLNFYYDLHLQMMKNMLYEVKGQSIRFENILEYINGYLSKDGISITLVNADNFENYRDKIISLEKEVYEPIRQTDISKFELTAKNPEAIAVIFEKDNQICAMSFAGPLSIYPYESGVRKDPNFNDPKSLYMIDTTSSPTWRAKGLGYLVKSCIKMLALAKGITRINGRNRHILAEKMWKLNLGLGAFEQGYFEEDYLDDEDHRDVVYYSIPTKWQKEPIALSNGIEAPLSLEQLDDQFIENHYPTLVNKVCLSNFASTTFLSTVKKIMGRLPKELRHGYTASGLSEATDKIAKTLRYDRASNAKFLTINGQYFGHGSFLSRSLSRHGEAFFPTEYVTSPFDCSNEEFIYELENKLKSGGFQAFFIEPTEYLTLRSLPLEILSKIRELTTKYNTPLVFNETTSAGYRYDLDHYSACNIEGIIPDAGCIFLGGQAAIVYTKEEYFIDKPLMMISTWDGDELSFVTYQKAIKDIEENKHDFTQIVSSFDKKMTEEVSKFSFDRFHIKNGLGLVSGNLPGDLKKLLIKNEKGFRICPNYYQMKKYLKK